MTDDPQAITVERANTVGREIDRITGQHYRINLRRLDLTSLQEFERLLHDLERDKRVAVRAAIVNPWRTFGTFDKDR